MPPKLSKTIEALEPLLERALIVATDGATVTQEVMMQIGLVPQTDDGGAPVAAAFRFHPLTPWVVIYGDDEIQAIELAIRVGESEAEVLGLQWPSGEAFRRSPST